jgi:sugar/nucleoside kinase (ribokinase family)
VSGHPLDVVAIGNALVDVLSHERDEFVGTHGLNRGTMTLIDGDRAEALYAVMGPGLEMSGGSAGNTATGIASLGGAAAFVGKVFDDQLGAVFAHDIRATGVEFTTPPATSGPPTGRCLIIVTDDAHRTMNTYLGASSRLTPDDIDEAQIARAQVTFLEGYLWDLPEAKDAFRVAARMAHRAGNRVALTLSDPFCVDRHRAEWLELVRDEIDIVFANESEVCSLYELDDFEAALDRIAKDCEIAAVTRSEHGSVIVTGGDRVKVSAEPVGEVVDTTGAGDLYAAGFLFGLTRGYDLDLCGRLASIAAAEVISHVGARPLVTLADLAAPLLPS